MNRKDFVYSPEAYAEWYGERWMQRIRTANDLRREYITHATVKIPKISLTLPRKINLNDKQCLELGFGCGMGLWILSWMFPRARIYAIDFNPAAKKLIPEIESVLHNPLVSLNIGDCRKIHTPSETFDFVSSFDFYEHLPEKIYWQVVREVYRVLKPGGWHSVYVGQSRGTGTHVRVVPQKQTKHELASVGFEVVSNFVFKKPGRGRENGN